MAILVIFLFKQLASIIFYPPFFSECAYNEQIFERQVLQRVQELNPGPLGQEQKTLLSAYHHHGPPRDRLIGPLKTTTIGFCLPGSCAAHGDQRTEESSSSGRIRTFRGTRLA